MKKGGAIGKGHNFIREIKQRPDIHLLEMTHANRNRLQEAIVEELMINLC